MAVAHGDYVRLPVGPQQCSVPPSSPTPSLSFPFCRHWGQKQQGLSRVTGREFFKVKENLGAASLEKKVRQ